MRQSIGMFLCGLLLAGASSATAAVEFGIDASHRGPEIGKLHYGIFFEEINHAGDGGIYAELVRNRSFEDNTSNPDGWNKTSGVTWTSGQCHRNGESRQGLDQIHGYNTAYPLGHQRFAEDFSG